MREFDFVFTKIRSIASKKYNLVYFTCLILASSLGCGDYHFPLAPISGVITLNGEPVSNARVVFMPRASSEDGEAGPYSKGETDSEGRYELETVTDPSRIGAVVGNHKVIVSTRRARIDPNNPMREIVDVQESIPRIYHDYTKTPLKYDVKPNGTDSADFDL